uniref:Uncharacterized protein n=1 Tax=Panagrolaimus sp. ES5 TaxID=591445 RepID=A0AC34GT99_9BILA
MIEKKDIEVFVNDLKLPTICKIYDDEVEKLLINLNNSAKIEQIRLCFLVFINSFTMIPELWILWRRLENLNDDDNEGDDEEESYFEKQINLLGKNHFKFDNFVVFDRTKVINILTTDEDMIFQQSTSHTFAKTIKAIEKTACYPNGKRAFHTYAPILRF